MNILPVKTIKTLVKNYKYDRETKFLNKYCRLDDNLPSDVYNQLCTARSGHSGLADYARSKGVILNFYDGKQKYVNDFSEFQDDIYAIKDLEGKVAITVTQEKSRKDNGIGIIKSLTTFVPKDTKQITHRKVPGYFVVDIPSDGIQVVRKTSRNWEDGFLRTIYHAIEKMADALNGKK